MRPLHPTEEVPVPFLWSCEDCAYFVADKEACAHGYPNAEHRRLAKAPEFCKEFELA